MSAVDKIYFGVGITAVHHQKQIRTIPCSSDCIGFLLCLKHSETHRLRIFTNQGILVKLNEQQLRIALGISLIFEQILSLMLLDAEQIHQMLPNSLNCASSVN